ncbi:hypothetical protein SDC9_126086 [bioreactor metagenome]|uniref:Uncharacterized protein n=1 Tax=bioreactor metagenome TaxID=1076179 RepID=A0A645CQ76_9ZZZZ
MLLKDETDPAPLGGNVHAGGGIEEYSPVKGDPASVGREQPRHELCRRALSRA